MITLVTGATGFVGLNIVEALLERGDEVIAFGQSEMPAAALQDFRRFGKQLEVVRGDVRDRAQVSALFAHRRIDRLVHAAVITAGAEREKSEPHTILDVNIVGTAQVLGAARERDVGRIVYVSSGSAYGDAVFTESRLYEDETRERPSTLYQISKFAAERSALRLRDLWQLDLVCTRLGSVIGPWELDTGARDMLSTHFQLARLAAAGGIAILPQRELVRDLVYSRDVAAGIVALLEAKAPSHVLYNLSSGHAWRDAMSAWGEQLKAVHPGFTYRVAADGEEPNVRSADTQDRGSMDVDRIARDIGFTPRFGPREAYADFGDWLRRHPDYFKAN